MSDDGSVTAPQTTDDAGTVSTPVAAPSTPPTSEGTVTPQQGDGVVEGTSDSSNPADVGIAADGSQATPVDGYTDFSVPDGMTLNSDVLEKATPVFKKLGLNQDQAQSLIDLQSDLNQASSDQQVETFNQMVDSWAEESRNDAEFGGDKFEESITTAQRAIEKFGTPELKELMETHGIGNHPEVVRFMVRVGALTKEDVPGSEGGVSTPQKDRVSIMYGNSK